MLNQLLAAFGGRRPRQSPARHLDAGVVLWAVGDIHGRSDLLAPLIAEISVDLLSSNADRRLFVGLGDYVDKGPDSRGVLDLLVAFKARHDLDGVFLCGNHEAFLQMFMDRPEVGPHWCEHGGRAALASYGVTPPAFRSDTDGWARTAEQLASALPHEHHAFLQSLRPSFSCGDYFFAHAGARPGAPLDQQSDEDLMWIRGEFTRSPEAFEKMIVHGHTPSPAFHLDQRRIGLDTGAYATGVLTALRLEADRRELLQIRQVNGRISSERRPLSPASHT